MSRARSQVAIAIAMALTLPSAILAQEHQAPTPPATATPKQTVGVTPAATPTQVAAAIAEALRTAEVAQTKRQATSRSAAPRPAAPRSSAPTASQHRYEVKWPSERWEVQWPAPSDGVVHLSWPD